MMFFHWDKEEMSFPSHNSSMSTYQLQYGSIVLNTKIVLVAFACWGLMTAIIFCFLLFSLGDADLDWHDHQLTLWFFFSHFFFFLPSSVVVLIFLWWWCVLFVISVVLFVNNFIFYYYKNIMYLLLVEERS